MPARGSALLDCSDLPIKLTLRFGKDPRPLMLGENLLDGESWTLLSLSRTRLEKPAQRGEVTCRRTQQARVSTRRDTVSGLTAQSSGHDPAVASGGGDGRILALQRKLDPQSMGWACHPSVYTVGGRGFFCFLQVPNLVYWGADKRGINKEGTEGVG